MRVAVLSNRYPPHAVGGYERVCADVVDRWRADGHDVEVLTSDRRLDTVVAGAEVERGVERSLVATAPLAPAPLRRRRLAVERSSRRTVDRFVDRLRPDVATVWNPAGLPLGAVRRFHERGVPTLFVVGDTWPVRLADDDPWTGAFRRSPLRRLLGRVAAGVTGVPTTAPRWDELGRWAFCSTAVRRLVAHGTGLPFAAAAVVPHGVDTGDFPVDAGPVVERPWAGRLLFVGRLEEAKGIDTLVRALALLPEASLDVCGPDEDDRWSRVRRVAAAAGDGVEARVTLEHLPRHALAGRYRDADAFVFPSEWEEPFGIVPLEAMACSTPVVATGTGGSADFLRDGDNCVLVAPGDPASIAAGVRRLADDPALRRRVVEGGRATAARLTTDHLAAALERELEALAD